MVGQKRKYENPIPEVDEGWWASVLAEEKPCVGAGSSCPFVGEQAGGR
jgi:hypothetical protein